ncbi:MAG: NADP-dependent oxidoreductase [Thermoplasmata archaeon]|nr:NADP-dependent oxidoreductase [Thermoplasmata archaeon]
MKAVAVKALRETPELMDLPKPEPGPGELLVHLTAASINPLDWKIVDGIYEGKRPHVFPLVLGVDGAGDVEAVGPGVTRFKAGDRVYGQFLHSPVGTGTYAEFATVPEGIGITKIPHGIYDAAASAVPTAGMTALQAIDALAVPRGKTLLVLGARGGVGSYVTQIASNNGILVIAAGRGDHGAYLRKLGAYQYFDLTPSGFLNDFKFSQPNGVDAVLDLAYTGAEFERSITLAREGGIVASTRGAVNEEAVAAAGRRGINVNLAPNSALLDRLSSELASGRLRVPVETQVPLAAFAEALDANRSGAAKGKTVLKI